MVKIIAKERAGMNWLLEIDGISLGLLLVVTVLVNKLRTDRSDFNE